MKGIFINAEKNLIQVFQAINLLFTVWAHSRGEHTIRNVKFLSKNFILTKPQHFHKFFTPIFFSQFFSWNQSCQQLKSPKSQHFHEFFTQIKSTIFLMKLKLVRHHNIFTSFSPKKSTIILENQSWISGQKMKFSNSVEERKKVALHFSVTWKLKRSLLFSNTYYRCIYFKGLFFWVKNLPDELLAHPATAWTSPFVTDLYLNSLLHFGFLPIVYFLIRIITSFTNLLVSSERWRTKSQVKILGALHSSAFLMNRNCYLSVINLPTWTELNFKL